MINFLVEKAKKLKFFKALEKDLKAARMKTPYTIYFKNLFSFTLISFFISIIFSLLLLFLNFKYFFLPLLFPLIVFLTLYTYPKYIANSLAIKIENELPYAISHLSSIVESNIAPHVMFRILSSFKEYEGVGKELKEIVRRMDVYGLDFISAIRSVAKTTPSKTFQKFLNNLVTTIESGGDIKGFLKVMYDQISFEWKIKREEFIQRLSIFSELYVGLVIATPMFIVSMLVMMNIIQAGNLMGLSLVDWIIIGTYLLLPLLNIIFLLFIKGIEVEA